MSFLDRTLRGVPYREFLKEEARKIGDDDVLGLAAELAYRFFLALLPLVMFTGAAGAAVAGLLGLQNPSELLLNALTSQLPQEVAGTLEQQLSEALKEPHPTIVLGTLIASLLAGAGGMNALIKGFNRIHSLDEGRPFWKRYAIAAALSAASGVFLLSALAIFVTGGFYGGRLMQAVGLSEGSGIILAVARWPVSFVFLTAMVGFLYWAAPADRLPFRWASLGAVAFAVGWLIATWLFLLYISNFGAYSNTYGFLAGIAILLIWLYITNVVLLAGAEANAILDRHVESEGPLQPPHQATAEGERGRASRVS
ncbi:MAG: YihY/virulence factor BrkB family protein [Dehalococcoidia bacterium]